MRSWHCAVDLKAAAIGTKKEVYSVNSVGIDIGSYSIKIAEIETSPRSFFIRDYIEIPLSVDQSQDRKVQIVDALRRIAAHYNTLDVRYVISVRQEQVSTRHRIFPFKEKHKILKSLPFELEEDIPMDGSGAIFDARLLGFRDSNTELLAVACPRKTIQEVLDFAHDAGIEPDIISVDGMALSNCFTDWQNPPQELSPQPTYSEDLPSGELPPVSERPATLVLDIGHKRTLLNCFHSGRLMLSRTIPFGGHDIIEHIRKKYGLPYAEAQKGLEEKGFILTTREGASKDQVTFSDTISAALEPLINDVKISLIKIRSEFRLEAGQVYLLGGVSRLLNLPPYLTQQIGIPSNTYDFLYEGDFRSEVAFDESTMPSSATAIGLALEGLRKPRNPAINLRKQEFGRQSQTLKNFWEKWSYAAKLAGVAMGLLFIFAYLRSDFADTLSLAANDALRKQAATPAVGIKRATTSKITKFIRDKKKEVADRKQLVKISALSSVLDVVLNITKAFPGKDQVTVDVRRLYIQNEHVTIEGEVTQRAQAQRIKQALVRLSTDRKVHELSPSIRPSSGRLTFAFSFRTNRRNDGGH